MEKEIKEQIARIERYSLLAAKKALNIDDVSIISGLSKSFLYKLTCQKSIPFYRPNGKMIYFDKDEINAWLLTNKVASIAEIEQKAQSYTMQKGGTA